MAISLGLDAFAVAAGVGLKGVERSREWRIGLSFALYQVLMPVVGLVLGRAAGAIVGAEASYVAYSGLIMLGLYMVYLSRLEGRAELDLTTGWGLTLASLTVSLDALAVGFSLGVSNLPILPSLLAIGVAAFGLTFLGLRFGGYLGSRAEALAELLAGLSLAGIGVFFLLERILA